MGYFYDKVGSKVGIGDCIAVAVRDGNTAELRIAKVEQITHSYSYPTTVVTATNDNGRKVTYQYPERIVKISYGD